MRRETCVQAEKVQRVRRIPTRHVVLEVWTKVRNVGSGVANEKVGIAQTITVGLHVAGGSHDEGSGNVIIAPESVHDLLVASVLGLIPGGAVLGVEVGVDGVEVDPKVNAGVFGLQVFQQRGVASTLGGIDEGIAGGELVGDAWGR